MISGIFRHLWNALRQLGKSPGFTAIAVISLVLGIGANTAIFTLIDELLLKSLPVRDPQNLVAFGQQYGGGVMDDIGPGALDLFPYDFYQQIERRHEAFDGIAAYTSFVSRLNVRHPGATTHPAELVTGHLVSGNFFNVLGAAAMLGRTIVPGDASTPGSAPVAFISYHYWQREFAGDPGVVGKSVIVNGTPFTVIGVAAPNFYGVQLDQNSPDMWLPLTMQAQVMLQESMLKPGGSFFLHLMARRWPGTNLEQMQEWVNLQLRHYLSEREGPTPVSARSKTIQKIYVELKPGALGVSLLRHQYAEPLWILMGLVAIVLLIACANLANFLLAKAASREREFSTRLALGANRSQVVALMLAEAVVLSLIGGAAGLLIASLGTRLLVGFLFAGAPYTPLNPSPDVQVLAFTIGVSLLTAFLFGLAPALRVSRVSVVPGASSVRSSAGEPRATRFVPKLLVVSQMALGLVLVMAAVLLVRTLRNLEQQDFGFNLQNLLCVNLDPHTAGFKPERLGALYQAVLYRMQALPGVHSASLSFALPMSDVGWSSPIRPKGYVPQPDEDRSTLINQVSARYFETVGIPVLAGRAIGPQDVSSSTHVVVINQTVAKHFFPQGNVIGQSVTFDEPGFKGEWEIVGIVKDAENVGPRETPSRMVYLSTSQLPADDLYSDWLELKTVGDPENLRQEVSNAMAEVDPNVPIVKVETMRQRLDFFTRKEALISRLSIFFCLLALLLACIGLYGVMTYNVVRRTGELGVRMALGAQPKGILWLVLNESLALLGLGIALGVPAALGASRSLQGQLFGIKSSDPLTVFIAVLTITATTLIAGYLPARRATRIDPMVALRYE